jgi:hypothetical protein
VRLRASCAFSPKGAQYNSLWQRHRKQAIIIITSPEGASYYCALSGLNYVCVSVTQGVALGYYIAPLWGLGKVQRWGRAHLPLGGVARIDRLDLFEEIAAVNNVVEFDDAFAACQVFDQLF